MKPSAPCAVTFWDLRAVLWALPLRGDSRGCQHPAAHVDPKGLQLPAGVCPSALRPAVRLLFPWMHSHIRHVQTLAAVLSPVCKQHLRTALLYHLRSLGGLLSPSLGTTKLWVPAQRHVQTPLYLIAQWPPRCVCMEDRSTPGAPNVPCVAVKAELEFNFQRDKLCQGSLLWTRGMQGYSAAPEPPCPLQQHCLSLAYG